MESHLSIYQAFRSRVCSFPVCCFDIPLVTPTLSQDRAPKQILHLRTEKLMQSPFRMQTCLPSSMSRSLSITNAGWAAEQLLCRLSTSIHIMPFPPERQDAQLSKLYIYISLSLSLSGARARSDTDAVTKFEIRTNCPNPTILSLLASL